MAASPIRHDHQRLLELDALRGLAATGVMLFHYITIFPGTFPEAPAMDQAVRTIFAFGSHGVLLFFAISGFVITLTLESTRNALDFVVKRVARLYPVYWAALLITVAFVKYGGVRELEISLGATLANFTMVHGLFYLPSVDGVYWTLLIELCFYACMLILWASGALRQPERVVLGWLGVKILCWLVPMIPWRLQVLLVVQYIPFFLIGILCHRIWIGQRMWRSQLPYLVGTLMTVAMIDGLELALAGVTVTCILGATITGRAAFLKCRPLLWLGSISYALYLIHDHVGFVIMLSIERSGIGPGGAALIAAAAAMLLAAALRRFIERPAERAILDWWKTATVPVIQARDALHKEEVSHVARD